MDLLAKAITAKGKGTASAQSLLDARADVMKAHDQKALDAWRLAAGRAIDALSR